MYELDRVVAKTSGALDEVAFQTRDKIKATANLFHYMALNGVERKDSTTGSYTEFNGLSTLLTGRVHRSDGFRGYIHLGEAGQ